MLSSMSKSLSKLKEREVITFKQYNYDGETYPICALQQSSWSIEWSVIFNVEHGHFSANWNETDE